MARRGVNPATSKAALLKLMHNDPLQNAIWHALQGTHRSLALSFGSACRYPAAVAPFAAVAEPTPAAFADLASLLAPGETVYVLSDRPPASPLLHPDGVLGGLQMTFPPEMPLPPQSADHSVESLDCRHAEEMLALIRIAYPGFFRIETCRMGPYFGLRDAEGTLVAMGGTRFALHPWYEISGLCSHPAHPGRSFGTTILRHVLAHHRTESVSSFLHVDETNLKAIDLYRRVGFQTLRRVELHRVRRIPS